MDSQFFSHALECAFYQRGQGHCARGASCNYIHAQHTEGLARVGYQRLPIRNRAYTPNFWPCDYPPTGQASWSRSNGHTTPRRSETEDAVAQEETAIPEEAWVRRLKGVNVTFGPGATIATVALPWQSSAVRFSHMGEDFHKSTLAEFLHHKLDFQVPEAKIDTQPMCGGKCVADVTLDEPDSARRLIDALNSVQTAAFSAEEVIPFHHRVARFGSISGNKVSCSWHKPSWTATLSFPSQEAAWEIFQGFGTGVYKVAPTISGRPSRPELDDGPNAGTWKVKLFHVPASINRVELLERIPKRSRPMRISQSCNSYSEPFEETANVILKQLMNFGPLDPSDMTTRAESQRYKLIARFVDATHAVNAVKLLNNGGLPFCGHGKLTVQQIFTVRMRIPDHVYAAASQDIKALYNASKESYIYTTISPENNGFRSIKFEGPFHDKVEEAQTAFESIIAGELLTEDGGTLWSASFATNAWAYNEMRVIEEQLGVLILCDRQQRTLRMLGPRDAFGDARLDILKLCHQDPRSEFSIALDAEDRDALPWLLSGGFQHIGRIVGRDKVALDIVSQPRRLVISGSEADLQVAHKLWHNRHQTLELECGLAEYECTLCGFEAEYPIYTRCQHLYCGSCFEDMCLSCASTPVRTPAVRCYGDAGRCKELLTLPAIQENVSSAALERIFERMFVTFVSQNSDTYRYCPTYNCEQVYRVEQRQEGAAPAAEFEFNCPQCMVAICSRCHVSHDTLHCPLHVSAEDESI